MIAFFTFFAFFFLGIFIIQIVAQWKIFEKAGEPGWATIIPIYNLYVLLRIVGKPWWWMLLMFVPIVNLVVAIWMVNMLSKSFGKDEGFTAGLILLSFVFYPILGFSRDIRYLGPYGDPAAWARHRNGDGFEFEGDGMKE